MAPPSWLPVVDEWTEAAEDPVAGGDLDGLSPWEEEEDKDIKHEMETPAVDTEDEDEDPNDVDTGDEDEVTTVPHLLSVASHPLRSPPRVDARPKCSYRRRQISAVTRALKRAAEERMAMSRGPKDARGTSARRAVINARAAPPSLQLHLLSLLSLSTAVTLTRTVTAVSSL